VVLGVEVHKVVQEERETRQLLVQAKEIMVEIAGLLALLVAVAVAQHPLEVQVV
jgi:hypothetical protein